MRLEFLISCLVMMFCVGNAESQMTYGYRGKLPPNSEAGKCYAKCHVPSEQITPIEYEEITYPVYIGTDPSIKTKDIRVTIKPSGKRWVKIKASIDCLSSNPSDCLIWSLQDKPGIYETITVPKRPNKVPKKDIYYKTYRDSKVADSKLEEGIEWREVLCGNEVSKNLINQLTHALIDRGYNLSEKESNLLTNKTKSVLVDYQKTNGLPIGALDHETLDSLEISY